MSTYLVTGGAGFIGSNYLNIMVKKYNQDFFICLDKLTYAGNINNLKTILNLLNFKFIKGDICDENLIDEIFKNYKINYVINFAAESHVDNSIVSSKEFIKTNIEGVRVLLDASKKYKVKRFHQVSTDEVYGDLPIDSNYKFKETDRLMPNSPYSSSKASADLLVLSYFKTYSLNVTISRCTNNYGINQHNEKFITHSILTSLKENKIYLYGNGLNVRDWIHVDDHCKAIDLILHNGKEGEIYNIAGHNLLNNLEIANIIKENLNSNIEISFIKDRLGHDLKYALNTCKIEKELNFYPTKDFKKEIINTIDFYKNSI